MYRRRVSSTLIILGLFLIASCLTLAKRVENTSTDCSDLILIFARGSSSNPDGLFIDDPFGNSFVGKEEVPGAFFQWMETEIKADYPHIDYKAISIHNSGQGWSINGYPAVGVFDLNPLDQNFHNMLDAKVEWWPAGEYRNSVDSGAHEFAGQVNYEITRCPNQRIVIGGYSQGAHVVHEALKLIPAEQRNIIDNVVLFGDPKYIASDKTEWNIFSSPKAYPWVRGTADLKQRGLAGAEDPYVPDDMRYKTISWCHEDDFVCTGLSGLSWTASQNANQFNALSPLRGAADVIGYGHTKYPGYGVPEAAAEVARNLRSQLAPIEIARGGIDPKTDPSKKAYDAALKNNRPVDIMFAFNKTGGNDDAFFQYSNKLKTVLVQDKTNFPNLYAGSVMYTDMAGGSGANNSYVAAYTQVPNQLDGDMNRMFAWTPYIYGGLGGGGDYPENHGMAIERAGMYAAWRSNATKHVVIFAERPATDPYSFNACNSSLLSQLPITGINPCVNGAVLSNSTQSILCPSILTVLSAPSCTYSGSTTSANIISRSPADAVNVARAKGFTVDIIQPHEARNNIQNYPASFTDAQLQNLAESTGGLYLKYAVFDEAALRDAMWQILNHQPDFMNVAQFTSGSSLSNLASSTENLQPLSLVSLQIGSGQLLRTTPISGARSYGWDLDGDGVNDQASSGPVVAISSTITTPGFLRVNAYSSDNGSGAQLSGSVTPYSPSPITQQPTYAPMSIPGFDSLSASRQEGSSTVTVTWTRSGSGSATFVVISDPSSGVPLYTVPLNMGTIQIDYPESLGGSIAINISGPSGTSDPQISEIIVIHPTPTPIEPDPSQAVQDPVNPSNPTSDNSLPPSDPQPVGDPAPPQDSPQDVSDPANVPPTDVTVIDPTPDPLPPSQPTEEPPIVTIDPTPATDSITTPGPTVGDNSSKNIQKEPNKSGDAPKVLALVALSPQITDTGGMNHLATFVAGAQAPQNNPQGTVGGVDAVNQLFKDENIGAQAPQQGSARNWLAILICILVILAATGLLIYIYKKRKTTPLT